MKLVKPLRDHHETDLLIYFFRDYFFYGHNNNAQAKTSKEEKPVERNGLKELGERERAAKTKKSFRK